MKRFVFPLDRALEIRRMQAEAEQSKLETLLAQRRELDRERASRELERDQCWEAPAWGAMGDPATLGAADRYRRHLGGVIAGLDARLARVAAEVEAQRGRTVEARRRQELLEKLRARRRREWEAESVRELEELAADAHRARLHGTRRLKERQVLGGVLGEARE